MFVLMYLNTYELDHIFFSETRAYMALLMGAMECCRAWIRARRGAADIAYGSVWGVV